MDYVSYIRAMVGTNKIIMNAAACIIPDDEDRILLQLRGDDHFWSLPGGIMELGETPEAAALRELREETGLEGEVADPSNPPSGCYFHPRCRYARDVCAQETPHLRELAPDHVVSCHLAEELDLAGASMMEA